MPNHPLVDMLQQKEIEARVAQISGNSASTYDRKGDDGQKNQTNCAAGSGKPPEPARFRHSAPRFPRLQASVAGNRMPVEKPQGLASPGQTAIRPERVSGTGHMGLRLGAGGGVSKFQLRDR